MQAISSRSIRCHPPGALVLAGLFVVVGLAIPGYTQTVTSKKSSTDKKEDHGDAARDLRKLTATRTTQSGDPSLPRQRSRRPTR